MNYLKILQNHGMIYLLLCLNDSRTVLPYLPDDLCDTSCLCLTEVEPSVL